MDNQNTIGGMSWESTVTYVLILVLMDNQNTTMILIICTVVGLNPCSNG